MEILDRLPAGATEEDIYTGFWINRSLGGFHGATLTLGQQSGAALIAFIALYVGATGRSLWKMIRFALHISSSKETAQDGVYHQRQATLRNTPLAHDAALGLLQIGFAWHKRAGNTHRTIIPTAWLAIMVSAASVGLSIMSSRTLLIKTNEALISGRDCGVLPWHDIGDADMVGPLLQYFTQVGTKSFSYAAQCYNGTKAQRVGGCNAFTPTVLPLTIVKNASCPFAEEVCISDTGNFVVDTGYLDSDKHLGLNVGPRFTLRHRNHCAPLRTQGYTETVTDKDSGRHFLTYKYGSLTNSANVTQPFVYKFDLDRERPQGDDRSVADYKIFIARDIYEWIPELHTTSGSITLYFLDASEIVAFNESSDPWFSRSVPYYGNITSNHSQSEGAGVLGCVVEHTFCNPELPADIACISNPRDNSSDIVTSVWKNEQDQSFIRPIMSALTPTYLNAWYFLRGAPTLLSRNTILGNMQWSPLLEDQWQYEHEYMFKANLVAVQSLLVDYARGFWISTGSSCGQGTECKRTCYSQRVRSLTHSSFRVWVLALILLLGGFVMLTSMSMEYILASKRMQTVLCRYPKLAYAHAEWSTSSTLQLQRLAHENLGLSSWTHTQNDVPVTDPGARLAVLDISDTKHVRMVQPSKLTNELLVAKADARYKSHTGYVKVSSTGRSM